MERKITLAFIHWQQRGALKPLLVYGARQVGKSWAVRDFGRRHYHDLLEVDFERNVLARSIFNTNLDPPAIIAALEGIYNTKIHPRETLIFFDEIQRCPRALTALKYFAQDAERGASHYHVIAAGSLLGVLTQHRQPQTHEVVTFPVGKVDDVIAYPMDFEEFLWGSGQTWLAEQIRVHYQQNTPLDEDLHHQALQYYRKFLVIGGMPEVVARSIAGDDYQVVQKNIVTDYLADMTKYRDHKLQSLKDIDTYNSIPTQLSRENKKFAYTGIKKSAKSRDYYPSILWLKDARVAIRCFKSTVGNMPPKSSEDQTFFKFYLNDTGLLCHHLQVTLANLEVYDQNYRGAITENYVACALQSQIQSLAHELHYWKTSEKDGSAEVEFIIATPHGTVPIEVKTSTHVQAKSLGVFIKRFQPPYAIRLSEKNFGFQNNIKSVPLYAAFCLEERA
jgi:predicted AAA+ superfamily ATPase